jgi:hypothetical protein
MKYPGYERRPCWGAFSNLNSPVLPPTLDRMNARLISVLGTLPDGRAGLVLKQHPGWTAIYSAAPKLPTPLLRRIAELGKVHCFTAPGDVIWATHDLPAVGVNGSRPSHHHPPTPGDGALATISALSRPTSRSGPQGYSC